MKPTESFSEASLNFFNKFDVVFSPDKFVVIFAKEVARVLCPPVFS